LKSTNSPNLKHLKIIAASWLTGSTAFAAAAPRFSTAGFYPMGVTGRTVSSMNVA